MAMISRLRQGLLRVAKLDAPGRHVGVFQDDVFLVSYPKSGNTWCRFLFANLLLDTDVTFSNIDELVPDIYVASRRSLQRTQRPRVLKSHEYFDPRYRSVIYVVRDPRDVAVSYYHHHRKFRTIADSQSLDEFVARFLRGELDAFGTWGENVASWLGAMEGSAGPSIFVIRYEDLKSRPQELLEQVCQALGLPHSPERVTRAITLSSVDRMREMERMSGSRWRVVRGTRQDLPFVRRAQSGGWKTELSTSAAHMISRKWATLMDRLGYES